MVSDRVHSLAAKDPRGLYPGLLLKTEVIRRLRLLDQKAEFEIGVEGDSFKIKRSKYVRDNFVPEAFGHCIAEGEGMVKVEIEYRPSGFGQNWISGSWIGPPASLLLIGAIESVSLVNSGNLFLPIMVLPFFPIIFLLVAYAQLYFESNDFTYEIYRAIGEGGGLITTMDPQSLP